MKSLNGGDNMKIRSKKMLIIGATSAIAEETAKLFAVQDTDFILVARDASKLAAVEQNLKVLGAKVIASHQKDLSQNPDWREFVETLWQQSNGIDTCLVAHGTLSDQSACEKDFTVAEKDIRLNFLSIVSLLTPIANLMEARGYGTIAVISSVAGDRGRKSNYIYGAAKGALDIYLQGLRNRLAKDHVQVLTIKPGFVDTPMTKDIKKNFLFAQPQLVARDIQNAITAKKDILYTPWFWYWIMLIIRSIPEKIFKQMSI
jgi:decaprenylphospho-beta-D-erythro-pentofuranosid-2-ulose 2-reductase